MVHSRENRCHLSELKHFLPRDNILLSLISFSTETHLPLFFQDIISRPSNYCEFLFYFFFNHYYFEVFWSLEAVPNHFFLLYLLWCISKKTLRGEKKKLSKPVSSLISTQAGARSTARKIHIQLTLSALSAACGATASGKILTETIVRGLLCFRTPFTDILFQAKLVQLVLSVSRKKKIEDFTGTRCLTR